MKKRNRKNGWQWIFRVWAIALGALLVSCSGNPSGSSSLTGDTGNVQLALRAPSLVDSVTLVVSGGGLTSPRTEKLAGGSSQIEALVEGLPAATGYQFSASGADSQGTVLYKGSATADVVANQTVNVLIVLLEVTTATPYQNAAPVIDSVVLSAAKAVPGDVVTVSVSAHDPNSGDTISYAWTATGGSFGDSTVAKTTWTAPNGNGTYAITILVQDNHGAKVSVNVTIVVDSTSTTGSADVKLVFDDSPVVSSVNSDPGWLAAGVATALSVDASDPDGDTVGYQWSNTCAGTFAGGNATNSFTLATSETATSCTVTVVVSDGLGLSTTGTLTLPVGKPTVLTAPSITSALESPLAAGLGGVVTFEVAATDPAGSTLTFVWSATAGTLSTATSSGTTSSITWTAPSVASSDWQVTVKVTNASGLSASKIFEVALVGTADGGTDGSAGGSTGAGGSTADAGSGGSTGAGGSTADAGSGGSTGAGGSTADAGSGGSTGAGGSTASSASLSLSVAPGDTSTSASVGASLVNTTDTVATIAVSVAPDSLSASGSGASIAIAGLTAKATHTFTVTVTTSSGKTLSTTTNPLAFYDVVEVFHEPEVDDTNFTGAFTFDTVNRTVSNLSAVSNLKGVLFDGMYDTTVTLSYQLSSQQVTLGGVSGLLVTTFALPTTATFSGGGWAPGGTKTYGNFNAYALIFVNTTDPTVALAADQINWLAYADCTADGLMGKTCMTGTTVAAYGRVGTMGAYPVSQVTTQR